MNEEPKRLLEDALKPRAPGDGEPESYTAEELRLLVKLGLQYGRGFMAAANKACWREQAETFRRRAEIIWIFRGLSPGLRKRPSGQNTKNAVLNRLTRLGIRCSERTLARDYSALGGADFLRAAVPFQSGEDRSPVVSSTNEE